MLKHYTKQVNEATNEIKMNSKELEIKECSLQHSGANFTPTQVNLNKEEETCSLVFDDVIPQGPAVLNMSFKGIHNDKMAGFYRTKVTHKDGKERYNLVYIYNLLGRARPESHLRRDFERSEGPRRPLQHERGQRGGSRGRSDQEGGVRQVEEDVHLPAGLRSGRVRLRSGQDRRRHRRQSVHAAGKVRAGKVPSGSGHQIGAALHRLLRLPVPDEQAGPDRHRRLRVLGHGELGADHVQGVGVAGRREGVVGGAEAVGDDRGVPRGVAPVVRQPRHHGVVDAPVAQRGLRHLHGVRRDERVQPGFQSLGAVRQRRHHSLARARQPAEQPRHRDSGEPPGRSGRDLRRHLVPKGRQHHQDDSLLDRSGKVQAGHEGLFQKARLLQHAN